MKVMLDPGAYEPVRAHGTDAGLDLRSMKDTIVPAGGSAVFDTGVHVELPAGCAGVLISKSGLNVKNDMTSTGLVDEGYTGSIRVKLYNHGTTSYPVRAGDKISQLMVVPVRYEPVEIVDRLTADSGRGSGGFGSTGR